jgi:hypothetical protein
MCTRTDDTGQAAVEGREAEPQSAADAAQETVDIAQETIDAAHEMDLDGGEPESQSTVDAVQGMDFDSGEAEPHRELADGATDADNLENSVAEPEGSHSEAS